MGSTGDKEWLPTKEAMQVAGFVNKKTFLKCIRARRIKPLRGRRNLLCYSRAKMLELARDREAAEKRKLMGRNGRLDPLNAPPTSGEIEAQVFDLFDSKTEPADVVKMMKLPASIVDHLFEQWWKMRQRGQAWLRPEEIPPPPAGAPLPPVPSFEPVPSFVPGTVTGGTTIATAHEPSQTREALAAARKALADAKTNEAALAAATAKAPAT